MWKLGSKDPARLVPDSAHPFSAEAQTRLRLKPRSALWRPVTDMQLYLTVLKSSPNK